MPTPPIGLVVLGGVILTPLFGASCAWIAQWRYRRAMGMLLKKPASAIVAPPVDDRLRLALILGTGLGLLGTVTFPDGPGREPAVWQVVLRWVALGGVGYALLSAVRLAVAGMPPEPNFRLGDGVVERSAGKPVKAVVAGPAVLFDAREL